MAKYRHKDETELRWNSIRRVLTRELDTKVANYRERALNDLLAGAYEDFSTAIASGKTLELENDYKDWVGRALEQNVVVEVVPAEETG